MKSLFDKRSLETIKTRLRELKSKIEKIEETQIEQNSTITQEQKNEVNLEQIEQSLYVEEPINTIINKATIDKKKQLKDNILNIIRNENLTSGEVKKKIVDQARICSKASFYRYIQELKNESKIESISINNQEFLYSKI